MKKTRMIFTAAVVLLIASSFTLKSVSADYANCFVVSETKWGEQCGNPKSFKIKFRNTCDVKMDIKYALKQTDGTWSCGIESNVGPFQETGDGAWACECTGDYKWWARPSDKRGEIDFPTNEDINSGNY
ncbi:MAG TPA: hypothetical protein VFU15_13270 [Bacteroidia bacterium]|nr:hypothetical protein [Bacteroidia bacterium]